MKRIWIGRHRLITIVPILKALRHLNASQCDITRRRMRALIFVYIINIHAHAQNAPFDWLLSSPGLGVVPRLLSEICWLHIR